jgi:hypothetical protein
MNLIDYILDLFRSPDAATAFITDPDGALRNVGLQNVSAAQIQAVAATAAPAGIALGGGNPVLGLQRAVSDYHGISAPFQPSFAQQNDLASHNDTQVASNNDFMSPEQAGGTNAQNGAFNLGFGDITLGDKTTNTATDGGVVVAGDNGGDIVTGDGAVLGNNNHVNNGDVYAGTGSNVNMGDGTIHDNGTTATNGSTVIQGNEGPVFNDVDASGGNGGGAQAGGGHGGGSLIGIGGGNASGGSAAGGNGGGGGITYVDNKTDSHTDNSSHVDNSVQQHSAVTTEENQETYNHVDTTTDNHSVTGVSNEGNTMDNSTHFQPHDNHFDAF